MSHTAPPNLFTIIAKTTFQGFLAGVVFVCIFFIRILPHRFINYIMGNLFVFMGRFTKKHKIALQNLLWVYPHWDNAKRRAVAQNVWRNVGYVFVDMIRANVSPKTITIQGEDHYKNALKKGQGVLLVTPHLGAWEITSSVARLVSGQKPNAIYRLAKSPLFNWIMTTMRHKNVAQLLEKNDPKIALSMMRLFKQGETVIMLPDQKMNNGIKAQFLGRPSMTATGAGTFMHKGVPVIPIQTIRHENSTHYTVIFHPPLKPHKTGDKDQDILMATNQINTVFESWIHENPEQYFWIHRRWEKSLYK